MIKRLLKWAEVPAREDIFTWRGTTKWGNHDLYPIDPKEWTFGWLGFVAIWVTNGVSVSTWTLGSSYIAYGLTAGETIGSILVGSCIASFVAFFAARPGMDYHVGYTIMNRPAYGLRGTYVPIIVILVGGLVFAGMQAYFGSLAVSLIIGAVIPQFHNMQNTLPASAGITTQDLIGFVIYTIIYLPILYFVPPHQIRKCLYPSFIIVSATFLGILGWAVQTNGGTGNLIAPQVTITGSQRAFRIVQCMSSIGGTWGGAAERISDWTRFEKKRGAANPGMLLALPITVTICALVGVLATTASYQTYGTTLWNPLVLLQYAQTTSYTPACRAGTFFAGCGILSSQIFMNMTQNSIPYGMDLVGLFPKYLTMRRASIILTFATLVLQPWRFFGQAAIFITILSCVTIFFSASTAIVLSDFWIVRKRLWKVPDLFEPGGIYWFTGGWNIRCIIALLAGMIPSIPGFFMTCIDSNADNAAVKIFQITYFVAAPLSMIIYLGMNYIWPPVGLGVKEFISRDDSPGEIIEGVEYDGSANEKESEVKTSKISSIREDSSV
ncbi:hypothetical protein BP6252_05404 [Coleophoma cylindrospora]|uniref:Uncharacterized protein n=1 Tax=Coleophoma cylindrospora TaxID=1849047 RepID=A0A3D8RU74_9HELO|nr:hypothetical protein BP6252_05404 [Coleophoma cylindrospora]